MNTSGFHDFEITSAFLILQVTLLPLTGAYMLETKEI